MLAYWPNVAVPFAVQVIVSPTARVVFGQLTATPLSSVTLTLLSGTLPVLVTAYVQLTASPTSRIGPVGEFASWPLVNFVMSIVGLAVTVVAADACVVIGATLHPDVPGPLHTSANPNVAVSL